MSLCHSPVRMYRHSDGTIDHSPWKSPVVSELFRPCCSCIGCRLNYSEGWALRMVHESYCHSQNSFITLTYSPEKLPPGGSLRYSDLQLFFKKFRSALSCSDFKKPIRYFAVGEYGENFSRPHYHAIIFGFDFSDPLKYKGVINEKTLFFQKDDRDYFKSTFLSELWPDGFADVGDVDYRSCMYVAKYATKKISGPVPFARYGKLPEKALMSKRPPIGHKWLSTFSSDLYPSDSVVLDGKGFRVPRSYDKWLEKNNPSLYSRVKSFRENSMSSVPDFYSLNSAHLSAIQSQKNFSRDGVSTPPVVDEMIFSRLNSELEYTHLQRKG